MEFPSHSTVLFSMDPPKMARAKTGTSKKHPTNILCQEKLVYGIVSVLAKANIAFKNN